MSETVPADKPHVAYVVKREDPSHAKFAASLLEATNLLNTDNSERSYNVSSPEAASIILAAMEVEKELRENLVSRSSTCDGSTINVSFHAADESSLNASARAFENSLAFAQEVYKELG